MINYVFCQCIFQLKPTLNTLSPAQMGDVIQTGALSAADVAGNASSLICDASAETFASYVTKDTSFVSIPYTSKNIKRFFNGFSDILCYFS